MRREMQQAVRQTAQVLSLAAKKHRVPLAECAVAVPDHVTGGPQRPGHLVTVAAQPEKYVLVRSIARGEGGN